MRTLRIVGSGLLLLVVALVSHAEPRTVEDPYRKGARALRDKDYPAAIEAFERATELQPDHVDSWLKLGIALAAQQRGDDAIRAYRRAIELDPRQVKAHNNLANVHFRRGELEAAAEGYARALEIDPGYLLALYHYGWTLRQLNRPEAAERVFTRCLAIDPESDQERRTLLECRFYLGALRYRARDYAAAIPMMEEVLSVHPAHAEARYYLGMAYLKSGRHEEGQQQLEIHRRLLRAARSAQPIERHDDP